LAGEATCEDVYWFNWGKVHQTDISIVGNTSNVFLQNLGGCGIPFTMPPDNSSGYS
jgi:hypothetical protein